MASTVSCSMCRDNFEREKIYRHVEDEHIGPLIGGNLFTIHCGDCNYSTGSSGTKIIEHCIRTNHRPSTLTTDWTVVIQKETQRIRSIVSIGVEILLADKVSSEERNIKTEEKEEEIEREAISTLTRDSALSHHHDSNHSEKESENEELIIGDCKGVGKDDLQPSRENISAEGAVTLGSILARFRAPNFNSSEVERTNEEAEERPIRGKAYRELVASQDLESSGKNAWGSDNLFGSPMPDSYRQQTISDTSTDRSCSDEKYEHINNDQSKGYPSITATDNFQSSLSSSFVPSCQSPDSSHVDTFRFPSIRIDYTASSMVNFDEEQSEISALIGTNRENFDQKANRDLALLRNSKDQIRSVEEWEEHKKLAKRKRRSEKTEDWKESKCSKCCIDRFPSRTSFLTHMRRIHIDKVWQCGYCSYSCKRKDVLQRHVARHIRKLEKQKNEQSSIRNDLHDYIQNAIVDPSLM